MSIALLAVILVAMDAAPDFKADQLRFQRVRQAYKENEAKVKANLTAQKLSFEAFDLLLRAYKEEGELQVFGKAKTGSDYTLLHTFDFCMLSGELGPKRKQGDYQVPEGFYHIDRFNPASNFYLSLGINYPNASDRILGHKANLGGDIFIHGSCVSIGCIPITDKGIKELYIYAVQARSGGQKKIPVLIFPNKMGEAAMAHLLKGASQAQADFWTNLKAGHDLFETKHKLPRFKVNEKGHYVFTAS